MARISGVNLPNEKKIKIGLTYIYGIGLVTATKILNDLKIDPEVRVKAMSEEDVNNLRTVIEKDYKTEGQLRRDVLSNIKRLKEIRCYRGNRHSRGLPVRGQSTKTNNRTVRGNVRRTMASGKKASAQKT